jgi:maltose alpha-D-glucosyltransferase/alpha-amylase
MWYKDTIIYELHVKSFYDSNDDGIGDFPGLTEKLDFLSDLGITALWLLPFYPSPLRDDGYDIADYYGVHPNYGTLQDFRRFLKEAHRRDIKVITELVINHTSDQHSWFQRSRRAPAGSPYRDYYVWSDTWDSYTEARIIFKDTETSNWSWDPVAGAYYWHRFYSHQPDLNFDNPRVRKEIFRMLDYWFEMGVDGMRLDAIPYLYEREGTNCENLPETHAFLKSLRAHTDRKFPGRMFLAEANQWPEDAVAYFGEGDECHLCYHFPVMPRLYMALTMEDRFPLVDIMDQTPEIPDNCQWAFFLRNHDELTLEMVTDEERDHMYRVYARDPRSRLNLGIRRRLAPLLGNDRRKIELMNTLLFSLPGTPVLYYGDEIGMGDNYYLGDRDGVRTPMQWSADRNAGFSRSGPHQLYLPVIIDPEYHFEALNVETQSKNPSSLLWWMKRLISIRKHYQPLSRGDLRFLFPENPRVLAFSRNCEDQTLLVVTNLSRFHQVVELDLSQYSSYAPREVFSQNRFPDIGEEPYRLTLGPYGFLWLTLTQEREPVRIREPGEAAELSLQGNWTRVLQGEARKKLESEVLPEFLEDHPWYADRDRSLRKVRIVEELQLSTKQDGPILVILEAEYTDDPVELYLLPLAFSSQEQTLEVMGSSKPEVIARLTVDGSWGLLYDGGHSEEVHRLLLHLLRGRKKIKGRNGELTASLSRKKRSARRGEEAELSSRVLGEQTELSEGGGQSNTSIVFDNRLYLKLYRRFEDDSNPDTEVVRFLSDQARFAGVPSYLASLEYRRPRSEALVVALLQEYVPNQGDAWYLIQNALGQYYEQVLMGNFAVPSTALETGSPLDADHGQIDPAVLELIGSIYIQLTDLLGRRTAEMHRALASNAADPLFSPEPFSKLYQRSLYQSLRSRILRGLRVMEKTLPGLEADNKEEIRAVLSQRERILAALQDLLVNKISGKKTRVHGDYNLCQVLFTGRDFLIIDFEGEPELAPSARRLKYSPLRDVADMIRSLYYAAYGALYQHTAVHPEDLLSLEPYASLWYRAISRLFLSSYREAMNDTTVLPESENEQRILLRAFLLDKGIHGILHELNTRPEWLAIPVRGIQSILTDSSSNG